MVIREWLKRCPFVAILRGIETHEVDAQFSALFTAGIVIAEIPLNSPEPFESIRRAADRFGDRMLVGAGTVTEVSQVAAAEAAGARLIVSPNADIAVVREAKRLGLIAIPGCATATEAFAMVYAEADALKLFPADVMGPRMLTGLRAVLPQETTFIPVGGVDAKTIPEWREAGADGYGIGSALYKPVASAEDTGINTQRLLASLQSA